ncbi:MAG: arginine decarboxylase, pyruvoyl-dependent [Candidatus Altiarchaeales archaeon]|nr:arginine decarboxylase, pyruvoyl-dependent [Candidatus Altiarchaeales archaeon]MBD3417018.1 arginine decarboxylase, pyruvoyl-dependent [Candidatus Altiarchaeales archaeon]
MIPSKCFFTKGAGTHRDKLASFELALREAGIARYNLVEVSSIFPPGCEVVSVEDGLKLLKPGQIAFTVLAKSQTNDEADVSAAVGLALPKDTGGYGYLSEHHSLGEGGEVAGNYAEDLAATMLATTLGIDFDPNTAWDERKRAYEASGKIFRTQHIVESSRGTPDGSWTTAIAAAVFII